MLALILSLVFLALNAFFVAAEFALVKVHIAQVDRGVRRRERRAIAAKAVLQRLDRYLSVTQFGITVASLGLGWIGEPAVERFADEISISLTGEHLGRAGHIAVDIGGLGILTFLHLLLGELVPKFVAIQYAEATTLNTAIPLRIVNTVFWPVLWVLEKAQRGVLRLIGVNPDIASEGSLSEDEIVGILAASARHAGRGKEKQRIVERVLRIANRPVRQMMVPRVDVVSLPVDSSRRRAREVLKQHEFSRVLLVNESLDDVAGYLYAKDLFLADDDETAQTTVPTLRGLTRRVLFFPETQNGLAALQAMQRAATPFAVVVDEYGGTSGIVTLEDLVEEIVGDIRDELDTDQSANVVPATTRTAATTRHVAPVRSQQDEWEVDPAATFEDLREAGVPLTEEEDSAFGEPIGTLVYGRLGHMPHVGDVVRLAGDVVAEIVSMSRRRIRRLRVRVEPSTTPES